MNAPATNTHVPQVSTVIQVDVQSPDKPGLVHELTDILYAAGANLADTSFIVLGAGCRFTTLAEFPDGTDISEIDEKVRSCPLLDEAQVAVSPFPFSAERDASARITHRLQIIGGDRPGLVQSIAEIIVDHGANIVRLNAHREEHSDGTRYVTRFALNMADDQVTGLDNAISNITGTMRLTAKLSQENLAD